MNLYQLLFRRNQHYLTIRSRDGRPAQRYKVPNHRFLKKAWSRQNPDEDLYITKYPEDGVISTIILDFDSENDIEKAYEDCYKIYKFLQTKSTNSVIVSSGNKGYHLYIQIPATNFKLVGDIEVTIPITIDPVLAIIGLIGLLIAYYVALYMAKKSLNKIPLSVALKRE